MVRVANVAVSWSMPTLTHPALRVSAYSGHRDHSVRSIMITRSDDRDRSSERSDARAIVSSLDPPRNRI
jgi:hypothetical protein